MPEISNNFEKKEGPLYTDQNFQKSIQPKNLFTSLLERIKKAFPFSPSEDLPLYGRVQQLNSNSEIVLDKLKLIKDQLRLNLSPELFDHVESLMEPMIKDMVNIQKMLTQQNSVIHQAKAYKKYSNWMLKAEVWIGLEAKVHDKEAISQAIIKHIMHESDELIDQDLQVIRDYEHHIVDSLPLNEEECIALKKRLDRKLSPEIESLTQLKIKPTLVGVTDVFAWTDDVDRKRSKHFDHALQIIDEIIHEIAPTSSSEEEHGYLVEILTQLAYLEGEIPLLNKEIDDMPLQSHIKKALIESKLNSFEQNLHELNLDLRLTPELVERVQGLSDQLESISQKFKKLH